MSIFLLDEQDHYERTNEWRADDVYGWGQEIDNPNPPERLDLMGDCEVDGDSYEF